MRNHDSRYERFECGEGNACEIIGEIIGSVIGGGLGFLGSKEQADAMRDANEQNQPQFFGPGTQYSDQMLRDAARLYHRCAHDLGRATLSDIDDLDGFVDASTQVIDFVEGASLPLFTAMRAEADAAAENDTPAAA